MSIQEQGRIGESVARIILKQEFLVDRIMQADWLVQKNGIWYVVEVKHKARFAPPPFEGHGLDGYQADMRMRFYRETGLRCIFLVIDMDGANVFWQWLDLLEETNYFTTKNGVRIYNLENFKRRNRIA